MHASIEDLIYWLIHMRHDSSANAYALFKRDTTHSYATRIFHTHAYYRWNQYWRPHLFAAHRAAPGVTAPAETPPGARCLCKTAALPETLEETPKKKPKHKETWGRIYIHICIYYIFLHNRTESPILQMKPIPETWGKARVIFAKLMFCLIFLKKLLPHQKNNTRKFKANMKNSRGEMAATACSNN